MTSCAPLIDEALRALEFAERGSFSRLDSAARHDLEYARSLTPGQRIAALNEILLLAEALHPRALDGNSGLPPPSRERIVHGPLLM